LPLAPQDNVQVAIVDPNLEWLPAAMREWARWPGRRLAVRGPAQLTDLFAPPTDDVDFHRLLWRLLNTAQHAYAKDHYKGTAYWTVKDPLQ
jgi:hypothetical protein